MKRKLRRSVPLSSTALPRMAAGDEVRRELHAFGGRPRTVAERVDQLGLAEVAAADQVTPRHRSTSQPNQRKMSRTRYYRKRPGYRAYIASLWQALHPFIDLGQPNVAGLRADGLSAEQIEILRALLAELGELLRTGLGVGSLPTNPPDFFAMGAEMPASHFGTASPRLRHYLQPRGRSRSRSRKPSSRPQQADVDTWMVGRARFAFEQDEPLKGASVIPECMALTGASRVQARLAFSRLPRDLRRHRGQHDRWVIYRRAKDPA